jgi:putative membrane protein
MSAVGTMCAGVDRMSNANEKTKGPKDMTSEWNVTDVLASFRTTLANERTVLSYLRTSLTFFVAGVTFVHFFDTLIIEIIGWAFIPLGLITVVLGIYRYNREKRSIYRLHSRHRRNQGL